MLSTALLAAAFATVPADANSASRCGTAAGVVEVASGVYVRPGRHAVVFAAEAVSNIGFIVGRDCVAVVDTGGSLAEGEDLRCAIQAITTTPICYVITTHAHPDHMLGNLAFAGDGVEFIGHSKLPRAMAMLGPTYLKRASEAAGRELGSEHIKLPTRTIEGTETMDLGDRPLRLNAYPSAHTDHDLSVYDEKTSTLWLSDLLFMEHVPAFAGGLTGWISVLSDLAEHPAEHAVPGHGPPIAPWPKAGGPLRRYLTTLRDETRAFIAEGGDLAAAKEKVGYTEASKWTLFHEYHKRNVSKAFTELEWE